MTSDMPWRSMVGFLWSASLNLFCLTAIGGVVAIPMMPHAELVRSSPGVPRSQLADHMRQC